MLVIALCGGAWFVIHNREDSVIPERDDSVILRGESESFVVIRDNATTVYFAKDHILRISVYERSISKHQSSEGYSVYLAYDTTAKKTFHFETKKYAEEFARRLSRELN